MSFYDKQELDNALKLISSTISRCEKMQVKFAEGTSQHSLLKNRIKALYISKSLVLGDGTVAVYNKKELMNALPPVASIISKTEKAQSKYEEGSPQYKRFEPIIKAMHISRLLIEDELLRNCSSS